MATPSNPPSRPIELTPGDPLAGLMRWVADGRVDAAALDRAKQRWLESRAGEEATLAGVVIDLAERGRPVGVTTRAGRRITGPLVVVGADFAIVREDRVGDVVVPFVSFGTVRPSPGDPPAPGERMTSLEVVLAEALSELAAELPRVLIGVDGDEIRGELSSVGFDVATIVLDGPRRDGVHVPLAAIDHVVMVQP